MSSNNKTTMKGPSLEELEAMSIGDTYDNLLIDGAAVTILRVPGGWIYIFNRNQNAVFVPMVKITTK